MPQSREFSPRFARRQQKSIFRFFFSFFFPVEMFHFGLFLGDTHLVRLRNPWGKGEWNGPWSERSWEWDSLSDRDKELLSVRVRNEGEFWMAFDDFAKQFSHLDLVHIGPDDWMSEPSLQSKKPWRAVLARR